MGMEICDTFEFDFKAMTTLGISIESVFVWGCANSMVSSIDGM